MDKVRTEDKKQAKNIIPFVAEVARYFMDFLETDFHKIRNPKRQIKYKNKDNLQVCIDLSKYEKYTALVWKVIRKGYRTNGSGFDDNSLDVLIKNSHTIKVSKSLLQLINEQISEISQAQIAELIRKFESEIIVACRKYEKDSVEALNQSLAGILRIIKEEFISKFVDRIVEPISKLTNSVVDSIYQVEEDLADIFIEPFEEILTTIVNKNILGIDSEENKHIHEIFNINDVKNKLSSYFKNFAVGDLFTEVTELTSNKSILEKQECYLYLCDITYKNYKYPLFYIPIQVEKVKSGLSLSFDPMLYINKRAVRFIMQDIAAEHEEKRTLRLFSERIMYLSERGEHLIGDIDKALKELVAYFGLTSYIDINSPIIQQSKNKDLSLSNKCYLALFDKADESLVNDYEEILEKMKEGNDNLANAFQVLVDDFITTNPESYTLEIDDNWDDIPFEEKLVFKSPVPLNSEQRKILLACKKSRCKYITVEGPPGTGKSHTITAIVCDAILENKSVLVLSDKKEALDVVEHKITDTMNKVRTSDDFQNPILRLGKSGNTYTKILSTTSMEKIKEHYKATRSHIHDVDQNISDKENLLENNLRNYSLTCKEINQEDIFFFVSLEKKIEKYQFPVDLDELSKFDDTYDKLSELFEEFEFIINRLKLDNSMLINLFGRIYKTNLSFGRFKEFIKFIEIAGFFSLKLKKEIHLLRKIEQLNQTTLATIDEFLENCDGLRYGWLGYLWNYKAAYKLAKNFNSKIPNNFIDPQKCLHEIRHLAGIIRTLERKKQSCEINYSLEFEFDFLANLHELLTLKITLPNADDCKEITNSINLIENFIDRHRNTAIKLGLYKENLSTLIDNQLLKISDDKVKILMDYFRLKKNLTYSFDKLPIFNFNNEKKKIENLVTTQMTYKVDERVINFYENNRSDARALAGVIAKKQKFDKQIFGKLKNAFPCILAGIRDFAEYIPLESDLFDLIVIDEASQVSIAQALPALLRGKKIIVLGDKLQFSNVKSSQARTLVNQEYLNSVKEVFINTISNDNIQLEKLEKFNIKTSILEFFERITNYSVMLKKHFRGYRELISYSNKYFYKDYLQALKVRTKQPDDIIKFTKIEHDGEVEPVNNTNQLEIEAIIKEVERILIEEPKSSVGIITPHTNQQKLLSNAFQQHSNWESFIKDLRLKIMTFDTCQGEERDIIIYSMVANPASDQLWGVFIKSRNVVDEDIAGRINLQRLNVGFSRAKERIHFFISKPIEEFTGSIREALEHYQQTLAQAKQLPTARDTDPNSPMEKKVLSWLLETQFFKDKKDKITLSAQFPLGQYLSQLDKSYTHPSYKVDFFMTYKDNGDDQYNIIIEYDGFEYHFKNDNYVNEYNYHDYYNDEDIFREKVLESYGYIFLRINRFNLGKDPIDNLNKRIEAIISENTKQTTRLIESIHNSVSGLQDGDLKECLKCQKVKPIDEFKDDKLLSGYGRHCSSCKKEGKSSIETKTIPQETTDKLCPRCESTMVVRERRRDQQKFLGCSRFPRCRGTREFSQKE